MNMQENMTIKFNYVRILLILMLCTDVLSAQESSMDNSNIIHDTAKPVIEPLLMVLYGGELDSFMYRQGIAEVVFDTVSSSDSEQGVAAPPLIVADTVQKVIELFVAVANLEPVLYTELSKSSDIPVIPVLKLESVLSAVDSTDTGCLSDLCQQKLAAELEATHVLIWKLSQRRGVLKIAMNLKPVGKKSIGKTAHYYWGEPSEVIKRVRRACWDVNNKSYPEELITAESRFQKMWFMTEYYLGMKNTLIGAGALSTGLAVILLQGEEDPGPGIGLPPAWPGE